MDNENIRIEFVNGSSITSRYEPYQDFQYVDTGIPFDTIEITSPHGMPVRIAREYDQRGHRAHNLVYDEFAHFDRLEDHTEPLVDMINSVQTGYSVSTDDTYDAFNRLWNEARQYEFSIDGGRITIKQKEAPDFGELSPSQELNDFVNTLAQGE